MIRNRQVFEFLKSFEGAVSSFAQGSDQWTMWLPELNVDDRPITPASQLFFAIILRHDEQVFAIRVFFDCTTGKIRYYTSAVPPELIAAPEFENALSELFRHTLPVEPIQQRKLRRLPPARRRPFQELDDVDRPQTPRDRRQRPMAEPVIVPEDEPAVLPEPAAVNSEEKRQSDPTPVKAELDASVSQNDARVVEDRQPEIQTVEVASALTLVKAPSAVEPPVAGTSMQIVLPEPAQREIAIPKSALPPDPLTHSPEAIRRVQLDIGERLSGVLLAVIIVCGIIAAMGIAAWTYLVISEDPGLKHHRMQIEAQRLQRGG